MSQAFVKENEEQWLHDIPPTLSALINYLTRENNGVRVYEKSNYIRTRDNKEMFVMSNGMSYCKNNDGKWEIE